MTTLARGASITVNAAYDGAISVSTNGGLATVAVTPVADVANTVTLGPMPARLIFGPYPLGAQLNITNINCDNLVYSGDSSGSGGGGSTTLTGAVTGTGSGTIPTAFDPAVLDAAALALGFQHGGGSGGETFASLSSVSLNTSATPTAGATVAFAANACNAMVIRNTEGVDIEFQIAGTGVFSTIRADEERKIFGITDASQVAFRRADYAVATNTQVTVVTAELINTSAVYSVSRQKVTTAANGTYATLASAAAAAVEITNTGIADVYVKVAGGSAIKLRRGKSSLFAVANANQLSVNGAGGAKNENPVVTVEAEIFDRTPGLPRRTFVLADQALGAMKQRFGTNNWSLDPDFVMMASFMPLTRFNPHGKTISLFNLASNVAVLAGSSGATVADVSIDQVAHVNTIRTQDTMFSGATNRAVRVTTTTPGVNIIGTSLNNGTGINTTNCDIHAVIKLISGGAPTTMLIELFSTADGSGSDYHQLSVINDAGAGRVPANSYGARAFSTHLFTAIGAGADMTSIKYARFRYNSPANSVLQPERIMAVKKGSDRASIVFTHDDGYAYSMNKTAVALGFYGWPAVAYLSPESSSFGGNLAGGTLLPDNCRSLQNAHGWQFAMQNYNQESAKDLTAREWRENQLQGMMNLVAIGLDPEGARDGSLDGAGPFSTTSVQYKDMANILRTSRQFKNGPSSVGGLFSGYIVGTVLTVTAITSGAIVAGVLVGQGTDPNQTIISLASGTANTVGATYNVGVAQTLGSSGAPVAFCSDNVTPFAFAECNPPGDPYTLSAYNWDGSAASANDLQLFARMRLHIEQAIASQGTCVLATHVGWNAYYNAMVNYVLPWIAAKEAANLCRVTTLKDVALKQAAAAIA